MTITMNSQLPDITTETLPRVSAQVDSVGVWIVPGDIIPS